MAFIRYNDSLKTIAKNLRKNQTPAEKEMWNYLKLNYPETKFLRQKPLDYFIPDFYCIKKNLIIEIDGEVHENLKGRDLERDRIFLEKYKIKTIRFTNEDVFYRKEFLKKNLDEVLH